jgi:hypothetical protein
MVELQKRSSAFSAYMYKYNYTLGMAGFQGKTATPANAKEDWLTPVLFWH